MAPGAKKSSSVSTVKEKNKPDAAEKRRSAFQSVLNKCEISPTELARKIGLPTPNPFYNLLNGHSKSLSADLYTKVARVLPGVTVQELMGEPAPKSVPPVQIKTAVQSGVFRDQFSLPLSQMKELPLPVDDKARLAGAYAAIVRHPGAEQIYPAGTLLICLPFASFEGELVRGRRLIIERYAEMKIEVTVREVQEDAEGHFWLNQRSMDPKLAGAVKMPRTVSGKPWRADGEKYSIAGVVIGAFIPEV